LIPIGLGRKVSFIKGTGPVLDPLSISDVSKLKPYGAADRINSVFETVSRVRSKLREDKALIGFCGGPWTVATYMIEGKGSPTKEIAKRFAYENPEAMSDLLSALVISSAEYLIGQARAGADVLKIFESWAEDLAPDLFDYLVINPTRDIIKLVREAGIHVPIIGFPRGAGLNVIRYAHETGITAIAAGTQMPMDDLRCAIPESMPIQGNLDPLALRIGGKTLQKAVDRVILDGASGPYIFNLGHGVMPDVKIENVHSVVNHLRGKEAHYV
jgi:uroporphyrinogen decarboxylase